MHAFLIINGKEFPCPSKGMNIKIITNVSNGRNESNTFTGQRVGRDLQKLENLVWPRLSAELWSSILKETEKFLFDVTYCDPATNDWVTRKMYISDREGQPYKVDHQTGKTSVYADCKCSIVDAGN